MLLVGPTESLQWSDSLIAFSSFYYLIDQKNFTLSKALPLMNAAAGLNNVFQYD